jgi:hypothetical protein
MYALRETRNVLAISAKRMASFNTIDWGDLSPPPPSLCFGPSSELCYPPPPSEGPFCVKYKQGKNNLVKKSILVIPWPNLCLADEIYNKLYLKMPKIKLQTLKNTNFFVGLTCSHFSRLPPPGWVPSS